jgi:PIN domain nuclease of toxin-antitoxin system
MIILDTHALLWMDRNDATMGDGARRQIESAWRTEGVAVSAISFWESAVLAARGRIILPLAVDSWRADLLMAGIQEIPVDGRIAFLAASLPDLHKDPADRFILATALIQQATLITADARLLAWPGALARKDART